MILCFSVNETNTCDLCREIVMVKSSIFSLGIKMRFYMVRLLSQSSSCHSGWEKDLKNADRLGSLHRRRRSCLFKNRSLYWQGFLLRRAVDAIQHVRRLTAVDRWSPITPETARVEPRAYLHTPNSAYRLYIFSFCLALQPLSICYFFSVTFSCNYGSFVVKMISWCFSVRSVRGRSDAAVYFFGRNCHGVRESSQSSAGQF